MEAKKAILGWFTVAMMWSAPSMAIWTQVGETEGRWFYVGGVSMIAASMLFIGFKKKDGGS